jgi:uncharacterized protein
MSGASVENSEVVKRGRILGFDLACCLAIFGMVLVNYEVVLAFGARHPSWLRGLCDLVEGRAAVLFVVLAGIGITLLEHRPTLLKRAAFLLVFGYSWQVIWPGNILYYYGFYLLAGVACMGLRPGTLFILAGVAVAGFALLFSFLDYSAEVLWKR